VVGTLFHLDLIAKTRNFDVRWLGHPIRQNVLDLWTIQETITEIRPTLLIETGTALGGSATFFAHLFDLLGEGRVVTIDVERPQQLSHPRVTFIQGSSIARDLVETVHREAESASGPVIVILDSDHSQSHVAAELEAYAPMVSPGSFMLVQDGLIDTLPLVFRRHRPGPRPAIRDFLARHPEFELDGERCARFLITHHPMGWLRRQEVASSTRLPVSADS
jgi:cephalosporin hydroxylase